MRKMAITLSPNVLIKPDEMKGTFRSHRCAHLKFTRGASCPKALVQTEAEWMRMNA